MAINNVLWWLGFTVAAVLLQDMFQGVDFLLAGLILTLQEESPKQTLWLLACWVLIQEGTGSLAFGACILWYGATVLLFHLGRWLFESQNALFVFLLGALLSALHIGLLHTMAALQDAVILPDFLIRQSMIQALLLMPAWLVARRLRRRFVRAVPAV